jgi:hypothetical protein
MLQEITEQNIHKEIETDGIVLSDQIKSLDL